MVNLAFLLITALCATIADAQTYDGPASGQIPMQGPIRSNYEPLDGNDKLIASDDIGGAFVKYATMDASTMTVTIVYQDDAGLNKMFTFTASGAAPPTPSTHARYFGWSADQVISTIDFSSAATSTTDVGTLPTTTSTAYIWFAAPESSGYPTELYFEHNPSNQIGFFTQMAGTIDDASGEAHIVGVSARQQISSLSGTTVTIGYN